jgi:membrane protein YqaA with SNARE-associated domain
MSSTVPIEQPDIDLKDATKRSEGLLRSKHGLLFLGIVSLAEAMLLVPIITDPFLVAYIILHKSKVVIAVIVTTATSIMGGLGAYLVAAYFSDIALSYLSPESVTAFEVVVERFSDSTFALGLLGAITPVPFTLAALAAGAIKGNVLLFLLGVLLGRSVRYGIAGYLAYRFGEDALRIARGNIKMITLITLILVTIYIWYIL